MPVRFGKYKIVKRLALGGISEIFLAYEDKGGRGKFTPLSRKVIIKKLLPQFSEEPRMKRLIHYEARLLAALTHANIVQVYDAGVDDKGESFMVQEYIDGVDLKSFYEIAHQTGESIPAQILYYITEQLLRALVHVHELKDPKGVPYNLIHRDLSPTNVMISMTGDVKLLDFGLAKRSVDVTTSGNLAGKIPYMAPEQLEQMRIDPRIDLFALGSVLYELGTGVHRFNGRSDVEIIGRIRMRQEQPFSSLARRLPPEMVQIFSKAMVFDRDERYQSAREMLQELVKLPLKYNSFLSGRMELQDFMEYNFGATKIDTSFVPGDHAPISLVSDFKESLSPPSAGDLNAIEKELRLSETKLLTLEQQNQSEQDLEPIEETQILSTSQKVKASAPTGRGLEEKTPTGKRGQLLLYLMGGIALLVTAYVFLRTPAREKGPKKIHLKGAYTESQVFLNNTPVCKLPCNVTIPDDGADHQLRVESPGYFPLKKTLRAENVVQEELVVKLRRYELTLSIETDYSRVKVAVVPPGKRPRLRYNYLPLVIKELRPNSLIKLSVKWKSRRKIVLLKLPDRSWHTYRIDPRKLFSTKN